MQKQNQNFTFNFFLDGQLKMQRTVKANSPREAWRLAERLSIEVSRRRPAVIKRVYEPLNVR